MIFFKRRIFKIFMIGLIVRICLMLFFAHPFDMYSWYLYCVDYLNHGFNVDILKTPYPLWPIVLSLLAELYVYMLKFIPASPVLINTLPDIFNPYYKITVIPGPLFNFIIKFPMLITDILSSVFIYRIIKKHYGQKTAEDLMPLYYLNPSLIWISSAWGQNESIPIFFTLLCLYLLFENRIILSSISLLISTLFKVYPAIIVLPISVYLLKKVDKIPFFKYISIYLGILFVYIFFGKYHALFEIINLIYDNFLTQLTLYNYSSYGLTYWSWSLIFSFNSVILDAVSVGLLVFTLYVSFKQLPIIKYTNSLTSMVLIIFIVSYPFYISGRYISEQRFLWLLPFLLFMVCSNTISKKSYLIISLIAFLYMQKNFPYYLLPLVSLNPAFFIPLFNGISNFVTTDIDVLTPTPISALILACVGSAFSIQLTQIYIRVLQFIKK